MVPAMLMMRSALCGGGSEMGVSSSWWERCRRSGRRGTSAAPGRPITAAERWSGAETFVGGDRHPGFAVPRHCRVDRFDRGQDVGSSNATRRQWHWAPKVRFRRCCRRTRPQCPRCRAVPCRHLRSATSAKDRPAPQKHGLVGGGIGDLITQLLPGSVELTRDRHTVRVFTFEAECGDHSQPECRVFLLAQGLGHLVDVHRSAAVGAGRRGRVLRA